MTNDLRLHPGDRIIYEVRDGKWVKVNEPMTDVALDNFVITCSYGDWSGFRTLVGCQSQFDEIESRPDKGNGFRVVERV